MDEVDEEEEEEEEELPLPPVFMDPEPGMAHTSGAA